MAKEGKLPKLEEDIWLTMVGGPQNAATHTACQTATHGAFHQKKPGKPPGGLQTMAVGPTKNATHTACQTATHGAFHQRKPGKLRGVQTMATGLQNLPAT